jgi:hypothetical protein
MEEKVSWWHSLPKGIKRLPQSVFDASEAEPPRNPPAELAERPFWPLNVDTRAALSMQMGRGIKRRQETGRE